MEKPLNCSFLLPLEEIALRRVIVSLWNQTDVLDLLDPSICISYETLLLEGQHLVKNRLSNLELPKTVLENDMVPHLIHHIGREIIHWKNFHERLFSGPCFSLNWILGREFMEKLCWTSIGTVNDQKTAKEIIDCKMLPSYQCIQLAVYYCLIDYIPVFWKELPDERKECFINNFVKYDINDNNLTNRLLFEEAGILNIPVEPFKNASNLCRFAFEKSALEGNKAVLEHFYQKLTHDEREISLFKASKKILTTCLLNHMEDDLARKLSDVFRYLFSQLNYKEQIELCKMYALWILIFFIDWPQDRFILDVAERSWDFLSEDSCFRLLCHIYNLGSNTSKSDLLQKIFLHSPSRCQIYFINKHTSLFKDLLHCFVSAGDIETVRFIFRNIDASREKILEYCRDQEINVNVLFVSRKHQ